MEDDDEDIDDEDEDEDEEDDEYPDHNSLFVSKRRRQSQNSELSRVSAADEETYKSGEVNGASKISQYEADPKREVFGDAGDQTEEISDENKSIVSFLV